jgi:hypothetical protein
MPAKTPPLQLFHRLAEPDSARARRKVAALGLLERVAFRNVEFESHRLALARRGGAETPALWDGVGLHVGLARVEASLEAASSGRVSR